MTEYISREMAIARLTALEVANPHATMADARRVLAEMASADVESVVRCSKCRYCEDLGMAGLYCNHPDARNPAGCRPDDYCNDGEL